MDEPSKLFKGSAWSVSDEKARTELNRFLTIGWATAGVALMVFGFLAIIPVMVSGRCIILSWRKANADRPNGGWLKVASVGLLTVGIVELALTYYH
jgi:hypothetical protein